MRLSRAACLTVLPALILLIGASRNADLPLRRRNIAIADGKTLRILPLGASITWGWGSTDKTGYRNPLRETLVRGGNPVNYVGSVTSGSMLDNQMEGWGSFVISQVAEKAELSLPLHPNVVLIQCGSNDISQNLDTANAHTRMMEMVDGIFQVVPEAFVAVGGLFPSPKSEVDERAVAYNEQLQADIESRAARGVNVAFVDFHGPNWSTDDLFDGTHPNQGGYIKMAAEFYEAIRNAGDQIQEVRSIAGVDDAAAEPHSYTATSTVASVTTTGETLATKTPSTITERTESVTQVVKSVTSPISPTATGSGPTSSNEAGSLTARYGLMSIMMTAAIVFLK